MFEFAWLWVFLLLPLPWLAYRLLPPQAVRDAALRVPDLQDFAPLFQTGNEARRRPWLLLTMILCWVLLLSAAARPRWIGEQLELPVSGRDLMLAVDLSGSMEIQDFVVRGQAVDRLTATKYVASDFIERRSGDRLGLILFGRNAYLQTPLTFDLKTVRSLLLESAIGLAGKETAIGDAIGLAIKRLKDNAEQSRVLILLTDGANTAGEVEPLRAAQLAASHGLKIYTIGMGADEMIRRSLFGNQRINPSRDLDEKTLRAIAEQTGGQYFRARDTDELEHIYQQLDELEPLEVDRQTFRPVRALFMWPLSAALVLGMLILLLRGRG
jgi:Ca-activated chloride channel family protein